MHASVGERRLGTVAGQAGGTTGEDWVRFFYDTEFIEDGLTIDLVSIGVVDEKGREFYAVSTEFDPEKAGPWVREHVLAKLPPPADPAWCDRKVMRERLLKFFSPR